EVAVLQHLSKSGFIAEQKHGYRLCQYAPERSTPEPADETSSNLIIKVTQSPPAWLRDTAILREWHRDLTQLIDGFRNEMIEFYSDRLCLLYLKLQFLTLYQLL